MDSESTPLTHLSAQGKVRMVDVSGKSTTERTARAEALVRIGAGVAERLRRTGSIEKGSVLEAARIAGILAAKRTSDLIPLCHQIPLNVVDIQATVGADTVRLESCVRCRHTTGVEMEAMTSVAVAALTVYDMCKAASKGIVIEHVRLLEKTGGKSGTWRAVAEGSSA